MSARYFAPWLLGLALPGCLRGPAGIDTDTVVGESTSGVSNDESSSTGDESSSTGDESSSTGDESSSTSDESSSTSDESTTGEEMLGDVPDAEPCEVESIWSAPGGAFHRLARDGNGELVLVGADELVRLDTDGQLLSQTNHQFPNTIAAFMPGDDGMMFVTEPVEPTDGGNLQAFDEQGQLLWIEDTSPLWYDLAPTPDGMIGAGNQCYPNCESFYATFDAQGQQFAFDMGPVVWVEDIETRGSRRWILGVAVHELVDDPVVWARVAELGPAYEQLWLAERPDATFRRMDAGEHAVVVGGEIGTIASQIEFVEPILLGFDDQGAPSFEWANDPGPAIGGSVSDVAIRDDGSIVVTLDMWAPDQPHPSKRSFVQHHGSDGALVLRCRLDDPMGEAIPSARELVLGGDDTPIVLMSAGDRAHLLRVIGYGSS